MAGDGTLYNSGLTKSEPVNGKYGPWKKIASHLQGPYMHPCVGPEEAFIIFDTEQSFEGLGKSLLISFRQADGSWGNIISFRKLAQFQHFEQFGIPMLSPDGKYLFFSSKGDIFWVESTILNELKSLGEKPESKDTPVLKGPYLGQKAPGDYPELFAPGIVSTCKEHSSAMFTPDGKEVWFARLEPAFVYFMEQKNGVWSPPKKAPFSGQFQDLYPVLSFDGKKLFFTSQRPLEKNGKKLPRGTGHMWVSEKTASGWAEPVHLGFVINFAKLQSDLTISAKGTVYFNAKDENLPQRSMDIFRSKLVNGQYTKPENVEELNSSSPEHSPYIAPDESYIIFSSFRGGYGRSDLFISFRKQDGTWSEPKNMGKNINSAVKDEYPYVSPDGKYLFFNSNRPSALNKRTIPDGTGNIYWVSANIIEELKPKKLK
jgi:hypothetical protein